MEYKVEPLDLMQLINSKYHEPFIRELICLDQDISIKLLRDAVKQLSKAFPLLNCQYNAEKNVYVEKKPDDIDDLVVSAAKKITNLFF